jgi:hypothetical protein
MILMIKTTNLQLDTFLKYNKENNMKKEYKTPVMTKLGTAADLTQTWKSGKPWHSFGHSYHNNDRFNYGNDKLS